MKPLVTKEKYNLHTIILKYTDKKSGVSVKVHCTQYLINNSGMGHYKLVVLSERGDVVTIRESMGAPPGDVITRFEIEQELLPHIFRNELIYFEV